MQYNFHPLGGGCLTLLDLVQMLHQISSGAENNVQTLSLFFFLIIGENVFYNCHISYYMNINIE